MKKTVWFPANKYRPVRAGWYEYRYAGLHFVSFQHNDYHVIRVWWDGKRWLDHPDDPKIYGWSMRSCRSDEAWRGRAK